MVDTAMIVYKNRPGTREYSILISILIPSVGLQIQYVYYC